MASSWLAAAGCRQQARPAAVSRRADRSRLLGRQSQTRPPTASHLQRTLEFHWGKHHAAYVNNLNNQIKGKEWENLDLDTVRREAGPAPGPAFYLPPPQKKNALILIPGILRQIISKSWNGGKPTPEFNNAAQVCVVPLCQTCAHQQQDAAEQLLCGSWQPTRRCQLLPPPAQIWNHTFFWECMSPNGGGERPGSCGGLPHPAPRRSTPLARRHACNAPDAVPAAAARPAQGQGSRGHQPRLWLL